MQTNGMKKMLPYLLLAILLFYGVPGIGVMIGGGRGDTTIGMVGFGLVIMSLIIINPAYFFLSTFLFQLKNGFHWYYLVLLVLLFAPVFPIVLQNTLEPVYIGLYIIIALAGSGLAWLVRRMKDKAKAATPQDGQ